MNDGRLVEPLANDPTRRQVIAGVGIALGSLALHSTKAWGGTEDGISHTSDAIHQEPVFTASRKRVYDALTDAKQFDKVIQLSGVMQAMHLPDKPAEIGREPGSEFKLFGGYNHGTTSGTCAVRTNRTSLANGRLGPGGLFDCEVRVGGAGLRHQDHI